MNRLAEAISPPKYQPASSVSPGPVPSEAVAVNQRASTGGLRSPGRSARIEIARKAHRARQRPGSQMSPQINRAQRFKFDSSALIVAAGTIRDRRAGKDHEAGFVFYRDGPLLGAEARPGRMDTGRRLAGCTTARVPAPRRDFHEVSVTVKQSSGEVDQVEKRRRLAIQLEWRKKSNGNLLVTSSQARFLGETDQLDSCSPTLPAGF